MAGEFNTKAVFEYGSVSYEADCIFDRTFLLIDEEGAAVQSRYPRITVVQDDIEDALGVEIEEGLGIDITVNNRNYTIRHVEPDGQGLMMIPLRLEEKTVETNLQSELEVLIYG
jgi:hypothetical protein